MTNELGLMAKCLMDDIDFNLRVEEFFDTYFYFEEAVKLIDYIEDEDEIGIMTEEGFDELLDCADLLETKIAELLAGIKKYFEENE